MENNRCVILRFQDPSSVFFIHVDRLFLKMWSIFPFFVLSNGKKITSYSLRCFSSFLSPFFIRLLFCLEARRQSCSPLHSLLLTSHQTQDSNKKCRTYYFTITKICIFCRNKTVPDFLLTMVYDRAEIFILSLRQILYV